jgi:thioredoxin-like negative regulator of GroEL
VLLQTLNVHVRAQVAEELGDKVTILKVDTEKNEDLSTQLQIQGLPTMIFVGMDPEKPALRTEGLLPAAEIKNIVLTELLAATSAAA